jgi:hypothetical protein
MPEGDAVRRTADRLHRALAGGSAGLGFSRVPSLATTDLRGATVLESTSRGEAPATTRFGLGRRAHAPADGCLVAPVPDRRSPGRGTGVAGPARADDCRLARHRLPPAGGHRPADPRGQPRCRPPRTGSAPTRSWKTTEALRRLADPGRPVRLVRRMMHQAVGSCLQALPTRHWVVSALPTAGIACCTPQRSGPGQPVWVSSRRLTSHAGKHTTTTAIAMPRAA